MIFEVDYEERFGGTFTVEADSPEEAQELFQRALWNDHRFSDWVSSKIEGMGADVSLGHDPTENGGCDLPKPASQPDPSSEELKKRVEAGQFGEGDDVVKWMRFALAGIR